SMVARQVVTFAYRLRPSRFLVAYGFDVPIRIGKGRITPILEHHIEVATGDGDHAFDNGTFFKGDVEGRTSQSILVGLRGHVNQALSFDAGIEFGVTSPGF